MSFDVMAADGSAAVFDVKQDGFPDLISFTGDSKPSTAFESRTSSFATGYRPRNDLLVGYGAKHDWLPAAARDRVRQP